MSFQVLAAQPVAENRNLFQFHSVTKLTEFISEEALIHGEWSVDTQASPLLRLIMEIEGVTGVRVMPYRIDIEKGTLFSWDKIAPKVMQIMLIWHDTQVELNGLNVEPREVQKLDQVTLEGEDA